MGKPFIPSDELDNNDIDEDELAVEAAIEAEDEKLMMERWAEAQEEKPNGEGNN